MRARVGAKSDVGRVRQANEDAILTNDPLYAVADGMGGHIAGDVASATAVQVIRDRASENPPANDSDLERYVKDANRTIWTRAHEDPQLHGMGTTCTLLLLDRAGAFLAHVGDSRAYLLRNGQMEQLTEDHTLVARMVREGRITEEEAHHHPQRSIITRALGVDEEVEVDLQRVDLQKGDRLLLCSDGLSSMLADDAIHALLESGSPDDASQALVDAANDAGGDDNVSVVVLDIVDGPDVSSSQPIEEVNTGPTPVVDPALGDPSQASRPAQLEGTGDPEEGTGSRGPRTLRRALIFALLVLTILVVGAFGATRYTLANAWFVGSTEGGDIAIYKGVPEEIAGLNLREEYERSSVRIDELPGYLQDDVESGIKATSLEEAREKLSNLEERSDELQRRARDRND